MSDILDTRIDIARRLYEYALGIDTRDWALYRSIFCDRVAIDFSSFNGQPAATMSADDWVAGVRPLFTGLDATQHVMTNPVVDIDGPRARCRMYMKAEHFLEVEGDQRGYALGGYYDDRLVLQTDGWRIEAVTLNVFWRRGDAAIMERAAAIGAERLANPNTREENR